MTVSTLRATALAVVMAWCASPALAADRVSAPSWTGFYVGMHAGYGWGTGRSNTTTLPTPALFNEAPFGQDINTNGGVGGIQGGYNWQSGRAVYGIEADFAYSGIKGSSTFSSITTFAGAPVALPYQTNSQKMDWFGTLRARAGLLATERLLVFATGGLAFGHVQYTGFQDLNGTPAGQFGATNSEWKAGWTLGGGAEWMVSGRWSLKADYLYYNLGTKTVTQSRLEAIPFADPFRVVSDFQTKGHLVRVGANYRFN